MATCYLNVTAPLLADFLRYLFPPKDGTGELCISTTTPTGALMVALAGHYESPVPHSEDAIACYLPLTRYIIQPTDKWYAGYDAAATARINLALKAEFELDFFLYMQKGLSMGILKKDIIDAYIISRGLVPESYDALHKRVYRDQVRAQNMIAGRLLRKAYYINESINYKGLYQ